MPAFTDRPPWFDLPGYRVALRTCPHVQYLASSAATRAITDGFGDSYAQFTAHCAEASKAAGCVPVTFEAKAGDLLFWHGNLVHAGGEILDHARQPTRRSLVCHYAAIADRVGSAYPDWRRARHGQGWYFARA